jgi:hypothetical protein
LLTDAFLCTAARRDSHHLLIQDDVNGYESHNNLSPDCTPKKSARSQAKFERVFGNAAFESSAGGGETQQPSSVRMNNLFDEVPTAKRRVIPEEFSEGNNSQKNLRAEKKGVHKIKDMDATSDADSLGGSLTPSRAGASLINIFRGKPVIVE